MKKVYRKHRCISCTFLLKIFGSNRGCGLSARTSRHHAENLHKLTSLALPHDALIIVYASLVVPKRAVCFCLGQVKKNVSRPHLLHEYVSCVIVQVKFRLN